MENASKALLIAGAILLVIAIIAIAVGIVSSTRGTIDVAGNNIDTMEVQMHNNQWTNYEGRVTGAEVKECIAKVLAYNTKTKVAKMKVKVVITGTGAGTYGNGSSTSGFSSQSIDSTTIYTGTTSISSEGIINQISFQSVN